MDLISTSKFSASMSVIVCGLSLSTIATIFSGFWNGIAVVGDLTSRGIIANSARHTVDQVASPVCGRLESQSVDIRFKTGKFLVEVTSVEKIVVDRLGRLGDAFTGH